MKKTCFYCGCQTFPSNRRNIPSGALPDQRETRDHIIPRSCGGTDRRKNIVVACERCNGARADLPAEDFILFATQALRNRPRISASEAHALFAAWLIDAGRWPYSKKIPAKSWSLTCGQWAAPVVGVDDA